MPKINGPTYEVNSLTDKSICESLITQNINIESSCSDGRCGVCKTKLLEGDVREIKSQISLSEEDKKEGKILTCCCCPITDIKINSEDLVCLKGIEIRTFPARISKLEKKTDEIIEVELRLPPAAKFSFLEGQYLDVIGAKGIRRSYSVASSMSENTITLWIKKVKNGQLSQYWFNHAKVNDLLRIEGPKGTFFFRGEAQQIVLLATGAGIAPIKSMLDKLDESHSTSRFTLYWGNRNPEDFFWQPNYKHLNLTYTPVLSRIKDEWKGETGYVQEVVMDKIDSLEYLDIYACGSLNMIEAAKRMLVQNGLQEQSFFSDAFISS